MIACPRCGKDFVQRTHRTGVFEEMASLLFVYPFRCQLCGHRFRSLQWGVRYRRIAADRRQYVRLGIHIPVVLSNERGEIHGKTYDLSLGGCAVDAAGPLLEGSLWNLRLQAPHDSSPIAVEAAVVRNVRANRVGLEFLRMVPHEKDRLGRVVLELLKGQAAQRPGIRAADLARAQQPPIFTRQPPPTSPR